MGLIYEDNNYSYKSWAKKRKVGVKGETADD